MRVPAYRACLQRGSSRDGTNAKTRSACALNGFPRALAVFALQPAFINGARKLTIKSALDGQIPAKPRRGDNRRIAQRTSGPSQALSLSSSARSFSGSSARRMLCDHAARSRARSRLEHRCLTSSRCAGCIEKLAQAEAEQQPRQRHVARHLAAHRDRHLRACCAVLMIAARSGAAPPGAAGRRGATRRRRCGRSASVYWIRSLVPIERKSSLRTNMPSASAAAGISIMPPTSIAAVERHAFGRRAASLACAISASVWSISCACASIGIRMLHLAVVRGAQDRAQLREEEPRLGEAEADRAQAQRRIGAARARRAVRWSCRRRGRACGWSPACRPSPAPPAGRPRTARPRRAGRRGSGTGTRCGTGRCRWRRFPAPARRPRQLDVGVQLDRACRRAWSRRVSCRRFSFCRSSSSSRWRQPVFGEHQLVGIDDHARPACRRRSGARSRGSAARALCSADDGRDVEAARDDRGVRGDAAEVGDEAGELVLLEQDHVGRRQVVRDQDQAAPRAPARRRRAPGWPSSAFSTRSTTCTTSALRSRR